MAHDAQAELHSVHAPPSDGADASDIDLINVAISKAGLNLLQTKASLGASGFNVFRRLTPDAIASGLRIRPPCRFQVIKKVINNSPLALDSN